MNDHFSLLVAVAALVLAGCGPISFAPGIRLGGSEVPTPASWGDVDIPAVVQLRVAAGLFPRVVNIWAVKADDHFLYVGIASVIKMTVMVYIAAASLAWLQEWLQGWNELIPG